MVPDAVALSSFLRQSSLREDAPEEPSNYSVYRRLIEGSSSEHLEGKRAKNAMTLERRS